MNEVDNDDGPIELDSILYTDIDPDMTLYYTYDTAFDDNENEVITGTFTFQIDINNDSIYDFEIIGRMWPGFLREDSSWTYFDTTYIAGLHTWAKLGYMPPSSCWWCPCNALPMVEGEVIDNDLPWGWIQYVTIHYTCNVGGCRMYHKAGGNNYLPIWLRKDLKNYYGWIDIDGTVIPKINGFAINLKHEKSIYAGQKE